MLFEKKQFKWNVSTESSWSVNCESSYFTLSGRAGDNCVNCGLKVGMASNCYSLLGTVVELWVKEYTQFQGFTKS